MKKGIIVELHGKQKVVLADNGRFYVAALKDGEHIGSNVKFYPAKKKIVSLMLVALVSISAFYGGVFVVTSANSNVCESLVQVEADPSAEFLLNAKGKVLSVAPLDEISAMLIAGENFKGMDAGEAVRHFAKLAFECGYINFDEESAVYVYGVKCEGSFENIADRVCSSLEGYFFENSVKAVVLENVSRPGLLALMTMFGCGTGKLRVLYEAAKIEQAKGDRRDTFDLMYALNGKQLKEILKIIRQGHITYNQLLSSEQKETYMAQKESKKAANSINILNYRNNSGYLSDYGAWVKEKDSIINNYTVNYNASFMIPCYVNKN